MARKATGYLPQPLSTLQETAFTDKQEATSRLKQSLSQIIGTIPRHAKSPSPDMGEGLLQLNIYIPAAAHELSICNCMPEIKTGQSSPFAPPRQNPEKLQQSPFAPSWQKPVPTIPPLAFGQTAARTAFCLCRPNDALLPVAGQMLSTASTSMSSFLTILSLLMALENGTYTTSSFLMPIITLRCPSRIA